MQAKRILVVEDEGVIAMELAQNLRGFGYDVVGTASSGIRAFELADSGHPDLIMMDIVIKGPIDGIETAQRIRAEQDVPVIFLTAYGDRDTLDRAKKAAPYGYLLKPYRSDELRATVEIALLKHQLEKRVRESEERFSSAFNHASIGMALISMDGSLTQANRALCDLLGFSEADLRGRKLSELFHPGAAIQETLRLADLETEETTSLRIERMLVTGSGEPTWGQISLSAVRNELRKPEYYIAQVQDISARKLAEEKLYQLAHFDPLTGLNNRAAFQERFDGMIASARRHGNGLALMFLDLDGFKHVNDSLGHRAGDDLLRQVTVRLKETVRAEDFIARLGGDEFVVALGDAENSDLVGLVANKLVESISAPYRVDRRDVIVTASIGISLYPSDGESGAQLLRNADSAMYHAKDLGKNRFCFYSSELTERAVERLTLESALRLALSREELQVFYQPIMENGRAVGVEALLRWQHPERGMVMPDAFIPLAEETGLLNEIGAWVLRTACMQLRSWRQDGLDLRYVTVNVSYRQLLDPGFQSMVEEALRNSRLPASSLGLEITETSIMKDTERTVQTLQALRGLGVMIGIDDFGVGHSSLSYLTRLPANIIKIDRTFVRDLPGNPDAVAVVNAIMALGQALSLDIVAEGVETAEQEKFLIERNIIVMQGFRFSRPVSADDVGDFLRHSKPSRLIVD